MRIFILSLLAASLLFACGETETQSNASEQSSPESQADEQKTPIVKVRDPRTFGPDKPDSQRIIEKASTNIQRTDDQRLGYWVGAFGKNKINLTLTDIRDGNLQGYSVCAGNFRPLQGSIAQAEDGTFSCELKEPGDDPYDGIFSFTLDPANNQLSGNWKPYQEKGNSPRSYSLSRVEWSYDSTAGDFPFASERVLYQDELMMEYSKEDLSLIRNEIYARHGYCFKKKEYRYHFEEKDWYVPVSTDVREQLSDIEVENIQMIYELEEYYDEYYDDFGR